MVPMLFGILTATFFITHVLPGDPAVAIAGQFSSPEVLKQIRHSYGFDQPLTTQYWHYLDAIISHFDLGKSIFTGHTVTYDLGQRLPSTLELVTGALFVALIFGVPVGAYAAYRRGRAGEVGVRVATFILLATPEFWFALIALYFVFFRLGLAPAPVGQLGVGDPTPQRITGAAVWDSILTANLGALKASLAHAAIPLITYGLVLSAPIARQTRSAMLEVLEAEYIRFGRACGLPRHVLWRYAMRAAMPPIVTLAGNLLVLLVGGAILIEVIFNWGGAAQYAADAIQKTDYDAIQGFILVTGIISACVFLIVDLLYAVIDPRVRLHGEEYGRDPAGSHKSFELPDLSFRRAWEYIATIRRGLGRLTRVPLGAVAPLRLCAVVDLKLSRFWTTAVHVRLGLKTVRKRINRLLAGGIVIILLLVVGSYLVPMISGLGPYQAEPNAALQGPSLNHPFGTDSFGFDIFTRVFYATRVDLRLAVLGVGIGVFAGVLLGVFVGFSSGPASEIVMRITDVIQAFPLLIMAIALVALTGNKLINVVWALGLLNAPIFLRLVRSRVMTIRELPFIEAAVSLGNSRPRLILRHVLPNAIGPAIVQLGVSLGGAVMVIASLAFLGVGVQVPTPEWGSMVLIGSDNITTGQWWTVLFPGLALGLAVASFNLLAEGVERSREAGHA